MLYRMIYVGCYLDDISNYLWNIYMHVVEYLNYYGIYACFFFFFVTK